MGMFSILLLVGFRLFGNLIKENQAESGLWVLVTGWVDYGAASF